MSELAFWCIFGGIIVLAAGALLFAGLTAPPDGYVVQDTGDQRHINHFREMAFHYVVLTLFMLASFIAAPICFRFDNAYGGWWCVAGVPFWFGMIVWMRYSRWAQWPWRYPGCFEDDSRARWRR